MSPRLPSASKSNYWKTTFPIQLFKRMTRAIVLTPVGQAILPALNEGFDKLGEVDQVLRSHQCCRQFNHFRGARFWRKMVITPA